MKAVSGDVMAQINKILRYFQILISVDPNLYAYGSVELALPSITYNNFMSIIQAARTIFINEPTVLNIDHDVIVVGDLHGHLLDLFRIFKKMGMPPNKNYLFLGDIVDRGEFSTETLLLILLLKIIYPDNVHIIRGNHEFADVTEYAGFSTEITYIYGDDQLKDSIMSMFSYIPLGAIVHKKYLCTHGGIGPDFTSVAQLVNFKKPLEDSIGSVVESCVWSDPAPEISGFLESGRGGGYRFGEDVFSEFMKRNDLELYIRGHECVLEGVSRLFGGKLMTVFSASNYCNVAGNMAGVLLLSKEGAEATTFEPFPYLSRQSARFTTDLTQRPRPPCPSPPPPAASPRGSKRRSCALGLSTSTPSFPIVAPPASPGTSARAKKPADDLSARTRQTRESTPRRSRRIRTSKSLQLFIPTVEAPKLSSILI